MDKPARFAGLRIKTLIWLFFIGGSGVVPFASIYYQSVFSAGNGDSVMGIITVLLMLQPLLSIVSNPVAGFIADRFRIENRMIVFCAFLTAAGAALIALPGTGLIPGLNTAAKLALIGTGIVMLGLFCGPIFPIINAEALDLLHRQGQPEGTYGRYRAHGSLSWIVFTFAIGAILSLTKFQPLVYVFYAAGFFLLALVALTGVRARVKPTKLPFDYLRKDVRFRRFIVYSIIQSFGTYGSIYFTGFFFNDERISYLSIGIAFAVSALLEIPVMFAGPRLTARFGNRVLVIAGTLILTLKLFFLGFAALIAQTWLIIPVMLIHGLGFALQFLGTMNIINNLAHPDLRATYLNLYMTVGVNIPWALGLLFFGWIIDRFGSTVMMISAGFCGVLAALYFIFFVPRDVSHNSAIPALKN